MSKNRKAITKAVYDATKALLAGGAKTSEIQRFIGIGDSSISRIRVSESWEYFCKDREARTELARKSTEQKKTKEPEQIRIDIKEEVKKSQPTLSDMLESIAFAFSALSEYLTNLIKED